MSYTTEVREVKRLTRLIDQAEHEADAWKWDRAEMLADLCEQKSQRLVATDVGMKLATLQTIVLLWRTHGGKAQRGSYADAYGSMPGQSSGYRPKLHTPAQKVKVAKELLADPATRSAVAQDPGVRAPLRAAMSQAVADQNAGMPKVDMPDSDARQIGSAVQRTENGLGDLRELLEDAVPSPAVLDDLEELAGRLSLEAEYLTMFVARERRTQGVKR